MTAQNTIAIADTNRPAYTPATWLTRIKLAFRAWRDRRQAAQAEARARELKWRFEIKERDGRLFLTCDGVAFQEIDPSQTAATVCELLRAARIDAQAYKDINQ